ncbi:hypothetical protein [uncultured Cohaesibacter sp.]|uniref:hypothetical protein n=1 Tax=uncultured Cohaesibacter sp. TaxID=1002546 RepID=UPI0029C655B8|nr:hypothetical protein [uncultured Cohaesibacter sp.]
MSDMDQHSDKDRPTEADARKARLSEALRNNLRRRKEQVRGRKVHTNAQIADDVPAGPTGETEEQQDQEKT